MRWRDFVDEQWAATFGITVERLRTPGTQVVPGLAGYRGVYVLRLGDAVLVSAPDEVGPFGVALGPSQHAYLHRDDFDHEPTGRARRLAAGDAPAIERFRASVPDAEWHEGGFGDVLPEVTWGVFAAGGEPSGELVAMGNMTDFAGAPADVGVVTTPAARGRGVATALVVDMLAACFDDHEVARYRALTTNHASLAVAARLGFERYGENVAIRLSG